MSHEDVRGVDHDLRCGAAFIVAAHYQALRRAVDLPERVGPVIRASPRRNDHGRNVSEHGAARCWLMALERKRASLPCTESGHSCLL